MRLPQHRAGWQAMGAIPSNIDRAIRRAIKQKRLIEFRLHDFVRVGEPHDYGLRNGTVQLLVYQLGGKSHSGGLPDWRCVKVSEISELQLLKATFEGGRVVPSGSHHQWDELYLRVGSGQDNSLKPVRNVPQIVPASSPRLRRRSA
jgi:hypothetical protein